MSLIFYWQYLVIFTMVPRNSLYLPPTIVSVVAVAVTVACYRPFFPLEKPQEDALYLFSLLQTSYILPPPPPTTGSL